MTTTVRAAGECRACRRAGGRPADRDRADDGQRPVRQLGAATAALAFPVLGPAGVVAIRQWVAGAVLLSSVRPKFRSFTRRQWRPVLALALIFATMNLSLYAAINTIGLGLAVTLEFLGPLSVALLASRRAIDLGCALAAAAAVVVLARPQPTTDYAGIGLALLAAACWAGYILVNRVVGERLPGSAGAGGRGHPVGAAVRAGRHLGAGQPSGDRGRARPRGDRGRAVLGGPDGRRPARAAPGSGQVLRRVHERQPGVRRAGRARRPRPVAAAADWLAITAIVAANTLALSAGGRDGATSHQPRRVKVPAGGP